MENNTLSEREIRRFQPQINLAGIGIKGQQKIKDARILVVGAGGKGTSALRTLMSAGVGYLGISDDTLIEEETLSRQSLYNDTDIGKQKAIVSKQYLMARNRLTEIKVHNIRLTAENLNKVIDLYDIIIDATNNFVSHYSICDATSLIGKPLIFGHIQENNIYMAKPDNTTGHGIKNFFENPNSLRLIEPDPYTPVIVVNTFAGAMLANEALNVILEKPSQLSNNMLIIKLSDYSFSFQPI